MHAAILSPLHLLDVSQLIDHSTLPMLFGCRKKKKNPSHMLALFSNDGLLLGTVIWLDVFKDLLCRGKGQQLLAVALLEY